MSELSPALPVALPGRQTDVALFIDWENFKYSLYEVGKMPSVTALMEGVEARYGRPVVARAYADWQDYYHRRSHDQTHLYFAGIEPVYVPCRRDPFQKARIKNSVDVKMSMDCMEVSFTNPHIKTFVLVTGDADFLHVANSLRRLGNRVIMIGVSGSTASRINANIDELVFYDRDIDANPRDLEPGQFPAAPDPEISATPVPIPIASVPEPPRPTMPLEVAVDALVRLVREQHEREEGRNYPPLVSWLGLQIRERLPSFQHQSYGLERFKDFVAHAETQGLLRIETRNLVDAVWLPEDGPVAPEPTPESPKEAADTAALTDALDGLDVPIERHDEYIDIVRTADEIENSHREYMAKGLLARFLFNKGHWESVDLPPGATAVRSDTWGKQEIPEILWIIESAVQRGLLHKQTYTDPYTGNELRTIVLNRTNPFVQRVLALHHADKDERDWR